jgi:hypothetical protein
MATTKEPEGFAIGSKQIAEIPHVDMDFRVFARFEGGKAIGVLAVDAAFDQVAFAGVREDRRRRGVATSLLHTAREEVGLAFDMDYGERSYDGDAWATAVGLKRGPTRRRMKRTEMETKTTDWLSACNSVRRRAI